MVNRSRNNAKSRRRSRRGGFGEEVIVDNQNLSPSQIEVVKTPEKDNESWTSDLTSSLDTLKNTATDLTGQGKGVLDSVTGFLSSEQNENTSSWTSWIPGMSSEKPSVENPQQMPLQMPLQNPQQMSLQKGGRGLGLTYYATPVNGLRVAEPTYMEYYKGGKRSAGKRSAGKRSGKRRTRRCKSKRCKKTCKKHHRHCRKY